MARSGIYIPSGNSEQDKISPKRGTEYPGVHWFYNNWDFDAAGLAFEQITHKDIFDALRDDLAVPLRFQDFDRVSQKKNFGQNTRHFEYATYLSTRDMARLGLLAMSHGLWGKTPWADSGFIDFSVYPTTHFSDRDELKAEGWTGRWDTACYGGRGMCRAIPATSLRARGRVRSRLWELTASTSPPFRFGICLSFTR